MVNLRKQPDVLKGEIIELEAKKEKLLGIKKKEEEKLSEVLKFCSLKHLLLNLAKCGNLLI